MKKSCLECRTVHHTDTSYCDACGYQFWHDPIRRKLSKRRSSSLFAAAILAGVVVAVARYWIVA
jgi:hypothetical protein